MPRLSPCVAGTGKRTPDRLAEASDRDRGGPEEGRVAVRTDLRHVRCGSPLEVHAIGSSSTGSRPLVGPSGGAGAKVVPSWHHEAFGDGELAGDGRFRRR